MSAYSDFEPSLRVSGYVAISPDGTRVAYADDASGQFNLVVHDIDGGKPQRVTVISAAQARRVRWLDVQLWHRRTSLLAAVLRIVQARGRR